MQLPVSTGASTVVLNCCWSYPSQFTCQGYQCGLPQVCFDRARTS